MSSSAIGAHTAGLHVSWETRATGADLEEGIIAAFFRDDRRTDDARRVALVAAARGATAAAGAAAASAEDIGWSRFVRRTSARASTGAREGSARSSGGCRRTDKDRERGSVSP